MDCVCPSRSYIHIIDWQKFFLLPAGLIVTLLVLAETDLNQAARPIRSVVWYAACARKLQGESRLTFCVGMRRKAETMYELGTAVAMAIAIGFAFAGISVSSYTLFTDRRLKFESAAEEGAILAPRLALLFLSGPYILMRNALKAAIRGFRPLYWLALSTIVASSWSFCTGLAILNLYLMIQNAGR